MKVGKVPNSVLEKLLSDIIDRKEVIVGAHVGKDTAILDYREKLIVLSTDPITGATQDVGELAINIAVNDLATEGAEPVAAMLTILAPEGTTEDELFQIMNDAKNTANDLKISIVGGHTEITTAVNQVIVNTAVLGSIDRPYVKPEIHLNDLVVITKSLGIEGTSILVKEKPELREILTEEEIAEGIGYGKMTSVVKEGMLAKEFGAKYMHDITEGGVLGAAWEASKANDIGLIIFNDRLPITEVTKKVSDHLDIDPRKLISSGSMMIIISQDDYLKLIPALDEENIKSTVIGRVIETNGAFLREGNKMIPLGEPKADHLYKALK